MKQQPITMTHLELEEIIHARAADSKNVTFTDHCLERLEEREITLIEALRCVRRGSIVGKIEHDSRHNTWKFRIQEAPPRDIVCLVAAISLDPASRDVIAITVWEI